MQHFEFHRVISANSLGRDFVVGDIHGDLEKLQTALAKVAFDVAKDRLFSVGDLIDRGPNNLETLHFYFEHDWFYAIRGNHEQMILDACKSTSTADEERERRAKQQFHYDNGGEWFWVLTEQERKDIALRLNRLPYAFTLEALGVKVGLVHAEVPANFVQWKDYTSALYTNIHTQHESLWSRHLIYHAFPGLEFSDPERLPSTINEMCVSGINAIIHGHTGVPKPLQFGNRHWIDTGYLRGELTLIEVSSPLNIHS